MAENIKRRSIDAYSQFEDWLSDQPFWLQDAAYRIYHGLEIGEEQISSYADMCILQANKQKTEYKHLNPNESKKQEVSSCMTIIQLQQSSLTTLPTLTTAVADKLHAAVLAV